MWDGSHIVSCTGIKFDLKFKIKLSHYPSHMLLSKPRLAGIPLFDLQLTGASLSSC